MSREGKLKTMTGTPMYMSPEVITGKIPGQQGYYRALAGMSERSSRSFDDAVALLPASSRKDLRSPEMRRLMAVPRGSFESRLRKFVQAAAQRA